MTGNQSNEVCLTGNCQFCGQKGDCVLLNILKKVENLENIIERLNSQVAV